MSNFLQPHGLQHARLPWLRGAGLLKAQKGPGKALKEAIPCPATP